MTEGMQWVEYESTTRKPKVLVIMLHGYGSNCEDLIALAPDIQREIPEAHFISVNAPFPFEQGPNLYAFQWFSLLERTEQALELGAEQSQPMLDAFIAEHTERLGVQTKDTVLIGFSQGAMMSLHTLLSTNFEFGAVVAYSGRLIKPQSLDPSFICNKTPILLVHGNEDTIVEPQCSKESQEFFSSLGFKAKLENRPKLGHGIDQVGLIKGIEFIKNNLIL